MRLLYLLVLMWPALGLADGMVWHTGKTLEDFCQTPGVAIEFHCSAYVAGVIDSHYMEMVYRDAEPYFCIPEGIPLEQIKTIVLKGLKSSIAKGVHLGSSFVYASLTYEFPPEFRDNGTRYCP